MVALVVALAVTNALITKEVEAVIVPTDSMPKAAAPVDPGDILVRNMMELAVTAVVATVAVPITKVTVPNELAPAVVVDATEVLTSLLPAVPKTTLPLVAVIFPRVAVTVVPADNEPVVATIFPVDDVIPVPAVTVVAAVT